MCARRGSVLRRTLGKICPVRRKGVDLVSHPAGSRVRVQGLHALAHGAALQIQAFDGMRDVRQQRCGIGSTLLGRALFQRAAVLLDQRHDAALGAQLGLAVGLRTGAVHMDQHGLLHSPSAFGGVLEVQGFAGGILQMQGSGVGNAELGKLEHGGGDERKTEGHATRPQPGKAAANYSGMKLACTATLASTLASERGFSVLLSLHFSKSKPAAACANTGLPVAPCSTVWLATPTMEPLAPAV